MGRKKSKFITEAIKTKQPPNPKNLKQAELIDAIHHKSMVFVIGPAGTGKTYISACFAGYYYKLGKIDKIIITRPTVPTGKSLGFFPGTLEEKMAPWVVPFMEALTEYLGPGGVETALKNGSIEIVPFETIRGRTFNDAFVLLDEAQNTTNNEIKAFLTRVGENSTTIINGDITQSDLKHECGLKEALMLLDKNTSLQDEVALVEFTSADIVRSGLCKLWVQAYERA